MDALIEAEIEEGKVQVPKENSGRLTVDAPVAFKLLGISRNTGYALIQRGDFPLPVIRCGRRILIPKAAIARLTHG